MRRSRAPCGCRSTGTPPRRRRPAAPRAAPLLEVERDPLAHLDRREPMRRSDENEAHPKCPVCRLSCMATTSAKPASVVYAALRPRQSAPKRRTQERAVDGPRQHGQHDQRVELRAVAKAGEPDRHPERQHRQRERDRPREQATRASRATARGSAARSSCAASAPAPATDRGRRAPRRASVPRTRPGRARRAARGRATSSRLVPDTSIPPAAYETARSSAASGITTSPSSRNRGLQPQIRYAPTTSQTKRLSDPAHVSHGKPSARAACAISSAVCTSQPTRTPHVATRPIEPGPPRVARVRDRGLAVGEQGRPEEELSHRASPARRASGPRAPPRAARP